MTCCPLSPPPVTDSVGLGWGLRIFAFPQSSLLLLLQDSTWRKAGLDNSITLSNIRAHLRRPSLSPFVLRAMVLYVPRETFDFLLSAIQAKWQFPAPLHLGPVHPILQTSVQKSFPTLSSPRGEIHFILSTSISLEHPPYAR